MNKKAAGGMIFFGMMIGVMIWIAFTQLLGPVTTATGDARSVSQLDCANSSISTGTKGTCVIVDWMLFGWAGAIIAGIIGAAGGSIIDSRLKKKQQ
ncbi:hypothetical protein LCGC14_2598070 [marine sediment metagenome]|uniref:Uncharacterized protein n=1 Tax=marine sediment metagenome TaxID=412755 RepID=A0A0F9D2C9_9ZZZZ